MYCSNCGTTEFKNLGVRMMGNKRMMKKVCLSCGTENHFDLNENHDVKSEKRYVVTSATNGFKTNTKFLACLLNYCKHNNAELVVLKVNNGAAFAEENYPDDVSLYLTDRNIVLPDSTTILSTVKLGTNLENPLHGMKAFSKGKSVILGHPQVQLRTLPRKTEKYPAIITTTGSVSIPKYSKNKTAYRAQFNHSYSAVFVEAGDESPTIRHLNFDGNGFYDIDKYYDEDSVATDCEIEALVTGDEHAIFIDKGVYEKTYGKSGLVQTLKPKYIVRHDVLDAYAISHHHKNKPIVAFKKHLNKTNNIEDELVKTVDFINETTPDFAESIIVTSNHNSHLSKWLNETDPKLDVVNMRLYHELMYKILRLMEDNPDRGYDAFKVWCDGRTKSNVRFLSSSETFKIKDVDVSNHGDLGVNGAKGSIQSFKDIPLKTVIGHSHSPGIEKGCYQVGTSTVFNLEYAKGLSSWHHCHCIIHKNGKRQLIFIT